MKAAVIVFPGSNCDRDAEVALAASMGTNPIRVWHDDAAVPDVDLIVVPGGFSYGDYLRAGAMAAHSPVMKDVARQAKRGVPVLGICNGFQILTEAGLLPGALLPNASLRFVCRDVYLRVEAGNTLFTAAYRPGQVVRFPIAHRDGNFFADPATLSALEDQGRVAFRYVTQQGEAKPEANPNGSLNNIAGILNEERNVLGLMPHPERLADLALGGADGRPMFDHLVAALS